MQIFPRVAWLCVFFTLIFPFLKKSAERERTLEKERKVGADRFLFNFIVATRN